MSDTQLRRGLDRVREGIADGWRHIVERAGGALTCFHPIPQDRTRGIESAAGTIERQASQWALLAAELRDDGANLILKLEVPGIDPDRLDVDVVDDMLIIRGEKRIEREETRGHYLLMECAYGLFARAVRLPLPVDPTKTRACYKNGVLIVTMLKLGSTARSTAAEKNPFSAPVSCKRVDGDDPIRPPSGGGRSHSR